MSRHPYRAPPEVEAALQAPPTAAVLRALDDYCVELRAGLAGGGFGHVRKRDLVGLLTNLLWFRRDLFDEMASRKSFVGGGAVAATGLIPFVLRWLPGVAGNTVGLALLVFAVSCAVAVGAIARVEAIGIRITEATTDLAKYIGGREDEPEDGPAWRFDVDEAGAASEAEALSAQGSPEKREGSS